MAGLLDPFTPAAPRPVQQVVLQAPQPSMLELFLSGLNSKENAARPKLPPGTNRSLSSALKPADESSLPSDNPFAARPGILGSIFGADSGIGRWTGENRGLLQGIGSALLSDGMDFSNLPRYAALDDERRIKAAEWDQDQKSKQSVLSSLEKYGSDFADIAEGLRSGAIDTNTAWSEMFKRHGDLTEQAKVDARNKGNAGFLTDPTLKAAVSSGAMSFSDAYEIERGKKQSLMNVGNGTIYDPNSNAWLHDPSASTGAVTFDDTSGLRKEIQTLPSYKNLAQAAPIYQSMKDTAGRNSKASDLNLVYGLGKIMDPTSVVREGEMVMVKNTASLPDWLVGSINALNGGQQLQPETRQAILREAYSRMKSYEDQFSQDAAMYRGIAGRYEINPEDILPNFEPAQPWIPGGGQDVPQITSQQEYTALPSGSKYLAPDGTVRTKP